MPHGTPDWGLVGPKYTTYGLDDLGEHAVRLGSIHLWDRRGDVVFMDDFEHGLAQGFPDIGGLNADLVLEGGHAAQSAFSIKLVAGSDGTRHASFIYYRGLPVSSRLGLEFSFTLHQYTDLIWWQIEWYTGVVDLIARVSYDLPTRRLLYRDTLGVDQELATDIRLLVSGDCWHIGKMVVDMATQEYVRFILNEQEWPLPGIGISIVGSPILPFVRLECRHSGIADKNPVAYLDATIFTHNEP